MVVVFLRGHCPPSLYNFQGVGCPPCCRHCIQYIILISPLSQYSDTFDVSRVDYTIHPGVINITVDYVHECESPHQFYVELQCTSISQTLAKFFNGSSGSINNVPSNEQCILLVTDGDAMNSINKTTPFNNTVMTSTIIDDNTSSPTTPSTKPSIGLRFHVL